MDSKKTARQILKLIGGENDIEHCSTRLRLSLKDDKLGKQPQIKKMHGIIGGRVHSQFQRVIDKKVSNVCDTIKGRVEDKQTTGYRAHIKKKWRAVIVDFLISIFQPLVPSIAGGGVLKLLLVILAMAEGLSKDTSIYKVLDSFQVANPHCSRSYDI